MALLSIADLKEHVETDLADDAIQRLLDASEDEINDFAGVLTDVTEYYDVFNHTGGRDRFVYTSRPIDSITNIAERDEPGGTETTLSANDYQIQSRREIIRLRDGDNPRTFWAQHVKIVYTPEDDTKRRKMAQVDLVQLMMNNGGIKSETAGDYSVTYFGTEYEQQKMQILRRLRKDRVLA